MAKSAAVSRLQRRLRPRHLARFSPADGPCAAVSAPPTVYGLMLDDCNFHEAVNLDEFDSNRALSLRPPDGEVRAAAVLGVACLVLAGTCFLFEQRKVMSDTSSMTAANRPPPPSSLRS